MVDGRLYKYKKTLSLNSKKKNIKFLFFSRKKSGGRNNFGKITVRHIGGGKTKKINLIDLNKTIYNGKFFISKIFFDPIKNNKVALVNSHENGLFSFILCPSDLSIGSKIFSPSDNDLELGFRFDKSIGISTKIENFPNGSLVHLVELSKYGGGRLVRSAGSQAKVLKSVDLSDKKFICILLPSGEKKYIPGSNFASFGRLGFIDKKFITFNKAGTIRRMGMRPKVRGVAMNPIDHPHGGGEGKSSGGRVSVSKWGKLTKGKKTITKKNYKKKMKLLNKFSSKKKNKSFLRFNPFF